MVFDRSLEVLKSANFWKFVCYVIGILDKVKEKVKAKASGQFTNWPDILCQRNLLGLVPKDQLKRLIR